MTPLLALMLTVSTASPVLTLDEALEAARSNNLELKVARARLEQAQTLSRRAWSAYLPTLAVSGRYTRNSNEAELRVPTLYVGRDLGVPTSPPDGALPGSPTSLIAVPSEFQNIVVQPLNALSAQVELRQAILAPGLWSAIQSARLGEKVAELNTDNVRREVLFAVAQAYYAAASLQEAIRASERLRELNEARVEDTRKRFEAGTVTRVALLRAQLDLTRAEQDLLRAHNAFAAARLALATLILRESDFELALPPVPEVPPAEAELAEQALEERSDVAAARTNVELARSRRRGVLYSYAPALALNGQYQVSNAPGFVGTNTFWSVTLGAQWTLWDGGLREANLREASAQVAEAVAQERQLEVRTLQEVARERLEYENARASLAMAEQALELARETQRLTELSFRAGVATYLEVADATATLTSAEVGFVSERLQASLAALRLLRAAGRFAPQ